MRMNKGKNKFKILGTAEGSGREMKEKKSSSWKLEANLVRKVSKRNPSNAIDK